MSFEAAGYTPAQFSTQGSVVLDGTGAGTVTLQATGKRWMITSANVLASTRVLEARCRVYLGTIMPLNVIDGTYSGSSGDTSDTVYYLEQGQSVSYQWTGGDVGATATVKISGMQLVVDRGFRAVR